MLLDHYRLFRWSHCCSSYFKVFYYYPLPTWYSETLLSWDVVVSGGDRPCLCYGLVHLESLSRKPRPFSALGDGEKVLSQCRGV